MQATNASYEQIFKFIRTIVFLEVNASIFVFNNKNQILAF